MRIAYVYDAVYPFSKGGGQRRIYEVATRLARRGHEVHWFSWKWWAGADSLPLDGVQLHARRQPPPLFTASGRRAIPEALRFGWEAFRLLRGQRFDVVDCAQFPYFHCFVPPVLPRLTTAFVLSWYEVWDNHWYEYLGPPGIVGKVAERLLMRLPDKILAVSAATCSELVRCGAAPQRIEVVPNGVDIAAIDAVPSRPEPVDLVYVGRLKNHKNLDVLLRALALLNARRPHTTLAIVGEGPERAALEAVAGETGQRPLVRFYGALDRFEDVIAIMKSAKAFVHPSTKEGGGSLTLFEAGACGLPLVGVDHPLGIDRTLIRHRENGLLISELTPASLAAALEDLLTDDAARSRMAQGARRMAKRFDWEVIALQHERIYTDLLQGARRVGKPTP